MAAIAACIVVFVGLGSQGGTTWRQTGNWGYISPDRIYGGAYWGLITSAFVHREIWHIAMNLYWLWFLGGALERSVGSLRYALFFAAAAFVSSSLQLALGGHGIGMSGVGYAIFGFSWIARERYPELRRIVTAQIVNLFLVWMVICIPATMLGVLNVGNAAHVSGLLFGMAVAAVFVLRWKLVVSVASLLALVASSVVLLFWAPWSMDWTEHRALAAHKAQNYAEATRLYHRALDLGADPSWAWHNLAEIYGYVGDRGAYADAIRRLRELNAGSAKEVEADYGPPEGRKIAVPSHNNH
jgi:GlpG protein